MLKPKPVAAEQVENHDQGQSHWRRLFMSLQQERVTVAERQLFTLMAESDKREEALKNYIRHLESDLMAAKLKLEECQDQAAQIVDVQGKLEEAEMRIEIMKVDLAKLHDQVGAKERTNQLQTATLSQRDDAIQMYKLLTQTDLARGEDGAIECCVTNALKEITTTFRLTELQDQSMMKYEPVKNPEPLPTFLHQAIEFETADCPALIQNILKGVFPDEE
jgi:predicted RNase H-like nuclease (RuvC/YqgF family)